MSKKLAFWFAVAMLVVMVGTCSDGDKPVNWNSKVPAKTPITVTYVR